MANCACVGAIHVKKISHGPLLPQQTGLLASYKQNKTSAPANRGSRKSGSKACYVFSYKQALRDLRNRSD